MLTPSIRPLALTTLLVALLATSGTALTAPSLVYLRTAPETGPALDGLGLELLAEIPGGYVARVGADDRARLEAWNLDHVDLGPDDPDAIVVVKYDVPAGDRSARVPAAAEVLHRTERFTILRAPTDAADGLMGLPDVQVVFRRPLRFVTEPWEGPRPASVREADPAIQEMVDTVTEAWLEAQVQTLEDFGTRHSAYTGGELASYWLRDQFLSYGYLDVALHDFDQYNDNVVCVKPGTVYPDRYVVIGGHFDSTSSNHADAPGADDNATGTVAVLAAARAMATHEFEFSVVFLCFSGEEQGLLGSEAWASEAAAQGLDIEGAVILDMLGYRASGDAADIDIIDNAASAPLRDLVDVAVADYVPDHVAVDGSLPYGASSDHASFWNNGYRAVLFFEDTGSYSPYIHTPSDLIGPSVNDLAFMDRNVRTAVATLALMARPFRIAIAHTPLGHASETGPFTVAATITAVEPLDQTALQLHYRTGGGAFTTVALAATGEPDQWAAEIPAQLPGTLVEYYLSASDVAANTATSPDDAPAALHAFRTGVEAVLVDDMETDQGWTAGVPGDDATTGLWLRADPVGTEYQPEDDHTPDPGTLCYVTGNSFPGDSAGAQDVDGGATTLLSPVFDLSGATWAEVSYWRYYVVETTYDDVFTVDISNDGGASWTDLETVDATTPWYRARFELDGGALPLTDQMQLRFIAEDTGGGSLVEALIDDVAIFTTRGDVVPADAPAPVASLGAYPNPFNPATVLQYALPRAGHAELAVYDAAGRLVARPLAAARPAGAGEVVWRADDLASGVYLVRLRLDGEDLRATKLTLLK